MNTPAATLLCLVLGAAAGWWCPRLIARIPEPEPETEPVPVPESEVADAAEGPEPKEPYVEMAALPGLVRRSGLAAAVAGGIVGWSVGWQWPLLFLTPLVPVSVALAIVDWRTRLLPTRVVGPTYALLIVLVLACFSITRDGDDLARAGYGWAFAGGLFFLLWFIHPGGMGYGDVRLSGVLGIALGYLGWGELVVGVYAAFLLGGFGGVLLTLLRIVERKAVPFGPFMLIGALFGIAAGPQIWAHLGPG